MFQIETDIEVTNIAKKGKRKQPSFSLDSILEDAIENNNHAILKNRFFKFNKETRTRL